MSDFDDLMRSYFGDLWKPPRLRKARYTPCGACGQPALDDTWGTPPGAVARSWKGCLAYSHGAYDCAGGEVKMTTPMPDPRGRCCWFHRALARVSRG